MAWEQNPYAVKITLSSAADYTAVPTTTLGGQFKFVTVSGPATGDTTPQATLVAATTARPIGILQNQPKAGFEAEVTVSGVSKVMAGAVITVGDPIASNNAGLAYPVQVGTNSNVYIVGTALSAAGAAGDIITVAVACSNAARGA